MSLMLKICGMREQVNIEEIASIGPDYMGFIFYDKSPRFIAGPQDLRFPEDVKKVGVFVNAEIGEIKDKVASIGLDAVQLHGDESAEYVKNLSVEIPRVEIIKAFGISESKDFEVCSEYEGRASYFLFDNKSKGYGGTGVKFNWDTLESYSGATPFFISGGIGPEDVEEALFLSHKFDKLVGIDINSGIEIEPGLKSLPKATEVLNKL